ncbi:MAG: acetoacetate decarboxylase family protein [Acidimicrobiales bacterium]
MQSVEVLGRQVSLPVEVREARSAAATFVVRHDAAARLMAGTGLAPKRLPGGRALCILAAVQYVDNDLGPYNEVAMCIAVGAEGGAPAGAYIHQLPVNGEFTCAAGRNVWGFPKWLADIEIRVDSSGLRCHLAHEGEMILDLQVRARPVPLPSKPAEMSAYARLDGMTRRTPFTSRATGVRGGPLGATLTLGDRHPMAQDLRSLGLPKQAVMSTTIGNMAATFGQAVKI